MRETFNAAPWICFANEIIVIFGICWSSEQRRAYTRNYFRWSSGAVQHRIGCTRTFSNFIRLWINTQQQFVWQQTASQARAEKKSSCLRQNFSLNMNNTWQYTSLLSHVCQLLFIFIVDDAMEIYDKVITFIANVIDSVFSLSKMLAEYRDFSFEAIGWCAKQWLLHN